MAELLAVGKEESARIRVENIVREDIYIELLEILELYCELLLARIALLDRKDCDPGLEEAVKTIVYAAPHSDIKELLTIRDILVHKFGAEFARSAIENENDIVPAKIVKRTSVEAPSAELVSLYLKEIARAYDVPFSELEEDEIINSEDESDDEGGKPISLLEGPLEDFPQESLSTPRKLSAANLPDPNGSEKSPISIRPPGKSIDNPNPTVNIPEDVQKNVHKKRNSDAHKSTKAANDDLDALRKRFEALKKK
jgi:vacuolar protein sorting-associated protein IST1